MPSLRMFLAALCGFLALWETPAQEVPAPPPSPVIREVSPGIFELGKIQLNQKERTVRLPAMLNMNEGIVEYLLVTNEGATHESLLTTDVQPNDLHFAMLLLGAKGSGIHAPAPGDAPPGQIDAKYLEKAPKLAGDAIEISVQWQAPDGMKTAPIEDWLLNSQTKRAMSRGPWIYNGSMFNEGRFLAQIEGAFAALVTYPSALINNPRKGNDNDQIWNVNEKAVPALKTLLEITIHLLPEPENKPTP